VSSRGEEGEARPGPRRGDDSGSAVSCAVRGAP